MFEKRETPNILSQSLGRKLRVLRQKTYHGNGKTRHDRAKGERRVRKHGGSHTFIARAISSTA